MERKSLPRLSILDANVQKEQNLKNFSKYLKLLKSNAIKRRGAVIETSNLDGSSLIGEEIKDKGISFKLQIQNIDQIAKQFAKDLRSQKKSSGFNSSYSLDSSVRSPK